MTLDISNYKFCWIKESKFEISKDYIIRLQRHVDLNIRVWGKDSIPLAKNIFFMQRVGSNGKSVIKKPKIFYNFFINEATDLKVIYLKSQGN